MHKAGIVSIIKQSKARDRSLREWFILPLNTCKVHIQYGDPSGTFFFSYFQGSQEVLRETELNGIQQ